MKRPGQSLLVAAALLPMAAWAVTLQYGLRVGDDLRYHEGIAAKGTLQLTTPLGAQTIPVEVHADEQRSLKTISAAAGGTFWLESRSLSAKSTITTPDGQQQQELPGDNFQVRLNPQGEVQEIKELPVTQRGDIGLDLKLDTLLNACRLAAFPAGDVQVGATWDKEIPLRSAGGRVTAKASSKLVGLRQTDAGQLAEIQTRYEVPIPKTEGKVRFGGLELPIQFEGRSTGLSTCLWDLAKGRATTTAGTGRVELKLLLVGLSAEPADCKFDLTLNMKLNNG